MRRIGLFGGMSWESSAEYYRLINQATRERIGGLHSADRVLRSVDFAEIEEMQRLDAWPKAAERLAGEARVLEAAGSELLVLCDAKPERRCRSVTDRPVGSQPRAS